MVGSIANKGKGQRAKGKGRGKREEGEDSPHEKNDARRVWDRAGGCDGRWRAAGAERQRRVMHVDLCLGQKIGRGDLFVVPAGTPHWFKEVPTSISYFVVKVLKP